MLSCALMLMLMGVTAQAGSTNETLEAEIIVNCMQYSDTKSEDYIVAIEGVDDSVPAPMQDKLDIKEDGSGSFKIAVSEPGTYDYIIYQKPGSDENTKYDDKVYHVKVFVTQVESGELLVTVAATVGDNGEKPDRIEFHNEVMESSGSRDSSTTPPVRTGDETNVPAFVVLAAVMVVVFIILLVTRKKNGDDDDDDES